MSENEGWKTGLQAWAERNGIKPAEFAKKCGYSYQHAYNLLRGETSVTPDTLGRILMNYGCEAASEIESSINRSPCTE